MQISIIIPTFNEEENIGALIRYLDKHGGTGLKEIIVVDGSSTDNTAFEANDAGAWVLETLQGRAAQMNYGAQNASGEILYFVHSDAFPPTTYIRDIEKAVAQDYPIGCFRFQFDSSNLLLRVNSYFTRFNKLWCRGGDQTLFITKDFFEELGGYNNELLIMEEYDLIERAMEVSDFHIIPKEVIVSARKYDNNNYLKVQFANLLAFNMFKMGVSPLIIKKTYQSLLNER